MTTRSAAMAAALGGLCAGLACLVMMRADVAPTTAPEETPLPAAVEIAPVPPAVRSAEPIKQARYEEALPVEETPEPETTEVPEPELETWREDVPLDAELQAALLTICEETEVDPLLALGLIQTESNFQPDIVSPTGDYGLCQLNYRYFDPDMTPEENMRSGIGLLAQHLRTYGDTAAALTAYNRGHDDGTRAYASVVLANAQAWGYGY